MIRSINKANSRGDGYIEMKDLSDQNQLKKLVFNLQGKMTTIQNLKAAVLKGERVAQNVIQFNQQFDRLSNLLNELKTFEATGKQSEIREKTVERVEKFIKQLHPEQVTNKLQTIRDELMQRSRNTQLSSANAMTVGPLQQQSQSYLRQLEADKKQLLEIEKLMSVMKQMINQSNNLLLQQGQQLRVGGQAITRARDNVRAGKQQTIEAVQYSADSNKLTMYCCILIAIIVTIILMIYYTFSK